MAFPEACSPPRTNESISVRTSRLWVIACLPKPRNLVCDVGASWSWILVGLWNWPAICWSDLPPPPLVASWLFVASMPKFKIQIRFCHACAYRFYKCWSPSGIKASLGSQSFSFALEVRREYHKAPKCFCVILLACWISSPNGPTLLTQWVPCTHAFRSLACNRQETTTIFKIKIGIPDITRATIDYMQKCQNATSHCHGLQVSWKQEAGEAGILLRVFKPCNRAVCVNGSLFDRTLARTDNLCWPCDPSLSGCVGVVGSVGGTWARGSNLL